MVPVVLTFLLAVGPAALLTAAAMAWMRRWAARPVFLSFLWGMFGASVLALLLQRVTLAVLNPLLGGGASAGTVALTLAPILEEALKALPVLLLALRGGRGGLLVAAAFAAGAGFAAAEAFMSLLEVDMFGDPDEYRRRAVVRIGYFLPMHAAALALPMCGAARSRAMGLLLLPAVLVAMGIHWLGNLLSILTFDPSPPLWAFAYPALLFTVCVLLMKLAARSGLPDRPRDEEYV